MKLYVLVSVIRIAIAMKTFNGWMPKIPHIRTIRLIIIAAANP